MGVNWSRSIINGYSISYDNPKADKQLNGNIELSAEQARLEVVHSLKNNILGKSSFLATEREDVMGSVQAVAA